MGVVMKESHEGSLWWSFSVLTVVVDACIGAKALSRVQLWTVVCQAPLSMGFSRWEYWSGLLCPPTGHLPDPGIDPRFLTSPALAGRFFTTGGKESLWLWIYKLKYWYMINSYIWYLPYVSIYKIVCHLLHISKMRSCNKYNYKLHFM